MMRLISIFLLAFGLVTNHALGDSDIESQRADAKPLIQINSGSTSKAPKTMAYTPDGRHYLIGDLHAGTSIFSTENTELITEAPVKPLFSEHLSSEYPSAPGLWYAGVIDDNTYYYVVGDVRISPRDVRVYVRQIEPPKRLHTHRTSNINDTQPVRVNATYITYPDKLINWHTGQEYPVRTFSPAGFDHALTDSGKVFSSSYPGNWAMLYDPFSDSSIQWKLGIAPGDAALTGDSRHVVVQAPDGACRVWPMPELKPVRDCGRAPWFASSGSTALVTDPSGDNFATAWRKRVHVYQVEPYQRTFELEMNNDVLAMALSANGRLAISSQQDAVEVWDIPSKKLLGRITTDTFPRLLAISPAGDEILLVGKTLQRLRVPKPE